MANARALDKRRTIRNIRKITRTMERSTARFKSYGSCTAATDYTARITRLVGDPAASGLGSHPLLEVELKSTMWQPRFDCNRGLWWLQRQCTSAGYPPATGADQNKNLALDVSGKRGISGFKFRNISVEDTDQFDDQPPSKK